MIGKVVPGKSEHFVPQHYLRQFCFNNTEQVVIALVAPFRFVGPGSIKGQCQEDYFYGENKAWDNLLTECEKVIAPVLVEVCNKRQVNPSQLVTIQMMAVILHHRTRKAVEAAKVTPRYVVTKIIEGAIKRGELPPCPDGDEGKWDFKGVPGFMIHQAGYCLMEMQTLCCKLLQCPTGSCFITSDNPVVILNQFCIGVDPHRNFTGFAKSGFQLLLPISPNLCLFFYDTKIYKVGSRQSELVEISKQDVEIINSLEIQSADKCLYFHDLKLEQEVWQLVSRYAHLRVCIQNGLRVIPIGDNKQFLHSRAPSVKLPRVWSFCRGRKHVKYQPGDLRKPEWTALGKEFMDDVERNPTGEDIFTRLKKFHKKIVDDFDQSQKTSAV